MVSLSHTFLGQGVYTLPEAQRLTAIPGKRIRRWMEGYAYRRGEETRDSPAIIESTIGRAVGELSLTFSDLVEIRFLDAFLEHGVPWKSIRIAVEYARELMGVSHPFSSYLFKTDGKDILVEISRRGSDPDLLNLVRNQYELGRVVPLLHAGLDFDHGIKPARWWPIGRRAGIVVDPERSFGAPVMAGTGLRTSILAASAAANGVSLAARLFEVTPAIVRRAVAFEAHPTA